MTSDFGVAEKSPEAFRTISEVAAELDVPQHVLRFWETKFATVKPLKRGGGRRYYRPDDLYLLRGIRFLLYRDGLTIKGVQKILRERGPRYVMELGRGETGFSAPERAPEPATAPVQYEGSNIHPFPRVVASGPGMSGEAHARVTRLLDELVDLKARLAAARQKYSSR